MTLNYVGTGSPISLYFQTMSKSDNLILVALTSLTNIQATIDAVDATMTGSLGNFLNGLSDRPKNNFNTV